MNTYPITLKFENEVQTINAIALSKKHATTALANHRIDLEKAYFISVAHNELNSFLDLTGIAPYQLVYFDEDRNFTGASVSIGNPNHLFTIQTTAKHILLIPFKERKALVGLERFCVGSEI